MEEESETKNLNVDASKDKNLDDVIGGLKFGKFHLKMLVLTYATYFSACTQMMLLIYLSYPIKMEWNLDAMIYPILPLCRGICSVSASFAAGSLGDKYGRQGPLLISLILMSVFGILTAFPPHFSLLVMATCVVAVGISGIEAVNFVLLLEILPRKNRGSIMVAITFCGALGAVYTSGMAWLLMENYGWRWFVGTCSIPSVVTLIYRMFVNYESPRYLFVSGRKDEAMKVLQEIVNQNGDKLPEGNIVCPPNPERGRISDLFTPELRSHSIFTTLVWVTQSMGFWSLTLYLPEYMSSIGVDQYFISFFTFVSELPGLALAMILIEPHMLGRIKCLRFFSIFSIISLVVLTQVKIDYMKAVALMVLYFFMPSIYSILNTYTPEIYPTSVRSIAMGFVYMVISFPSLFMSYLVPTVLLTNITWLYPAVGSAFFILQFLFTFGLKTESAGHGLIEKKDKGDTIDVLEIENQAEDIENLANGHCDSTA